jgi:hypothetical protein
MSLPSQLKRLFVDQNSLELKIDELNSKLRSSYMNEKNGLICQNDGDQGDTLLRMSSYYVCMNYLGMDVSYSKRTLEKDALITYGKLQASPNMYTRSVGTKTWEDETERASRDQISITLVAQAMVVPLYYNLFSNSVKYLVSRWFRHDNIYRNWTAKSDQLPKQPDVVSPSELGTMIRGLNLKYLYPILCILDLDILVNSLISIFYNKWDQSNLLIPHLIYSNTKYVTPFSWLAKVLVSNYRTEIEFQIIRYYSVEKNGIPPLGEIIILAFRKLIGRL